VRSIYVLRKGISPSVLERAKAVLVTSNSAFARAAWNYGKKFEQSQEVSTVITDFSLANMTWLKVPMGAPTLPRSEVLAYSYAALQPSQEFLNKYISEIEKLERAGRITSRDHQLLRSSTLAQDELMNLTLGQEIALTETTITETLNRVTEEIKKEEKEKLSAEKEAHLRTLMQLQSLQQKEQEIKKRIYWRCRRRARTIASLASVFVGLLLMAGLASGLGLRPNNRLLGWIFIGASGALLIFTISNLLFGSTLKSFFQRAEDYFLRWLLKRQCAAIGLDQTEFGNNK
ncbi:MAG: hypothetical protein QW761_03125, partial [Candidatus Aenigmatarchaeota archaeon]